ncbi:hypothetical protein DFH29DRAFT_872208 [Suillus ampliporus]|nr:hypothetical protein DFH29DRAFT_872208 [Suillus ampliporus]
MSRALVLSSSLNDSMKYSTYRKHPRATPSQRKGLFIVSLDPEIGKLAVEAPPRSGMTRTGLVFNWRYQVNKKNYCGFRTFLTTVKYCSYVWLSGFQLIISHFSV